MIDFKRKASSSSIEKLKTHPKFPLIETFLETLTSSSREVQHIMIFAKCLINIYLVLVCFTFSFREECTSVGVWNSRGWMAYQVQELCHIYWPTFSLIMWKYWQDQKSNLYSSQNQQKFLGFQNCNSQPYDDYQDNSNSLDLLKK